jgi:hypothetical protein
MLIDRDFWKQQFEKDRFPVWMCSTCNTGILELQSDTFRFTHTGESGQLFKKSDAWEPEWIRYRFCTFLKCNNKKCQDTAILTGSGRVNEYLQNSYGIAEEVFVDEFFPEYCNPPPLIFEIPEKTPQKIKKQILESFSVFFSQPNSAGNKIRTCIEILLTDQKINQTKISKKRKEEFRLSLHDRIKIFGGKFPDLSENILAIKWIGNSASHTDGLVVDDIFDSYELLHHVLNELYANRHKHINKLTKAINNRKGKLS